MVRIVASIIVSSLLIQSSRAGEPTKEQLENWHHWRGPLATGVGPKADPPITWNSQTNIKWKAELPGRGSATPIVWGDQVFILTAIKTDRKAEPEKLPKVDPKFKRMTNAPMSIINSSC